MNVENHMYHLTVTLNQFFTQSLLGPEPGIPETQSLAPGTIEHPGAEVS